MSRRRFLFLAFIGFAAYLILVIRLFYLQIIKGKLYKELSQKKTMLEKGSYTLRGEIFWTEEVKR